jgi:hypothetical protein
MFEHLKKWPRILVVGPQRSGTRIGATMISEDTGHWFVGEEEFGVDSLNRLYKILEISRNVVVQAPAMTCYSHLLGMHDQDLAVVLMRRDLGEIKASEERIRWRWEMPELIRCLTLEGNAAMIRYQQWDQFQKEDLGAQAHEIPYETLERHGLWIAKPGRARFGPRQTA